MGQAMRKTRASDEQGRFAGIARPSNVIEATTESGQGDHAAPFPMALPEFFIRAFTDVGDLVFDPFGGSGTSAVAALRNGRQGYCAELSPRYCDVIVNRLLAADARLEARLAPPDGDGRTFDQIRGERLAEVA
jgi:DNA modification methylase